MVSKKGDVSAYATKQLVSMLNQPDIYVPGRAATPGTPGHTVSMQAQRDQVNGSYDSAQKNIQQFYGQAANAVNAYNPQIDASRDSANKQIAADAAARQAAVASAGAARVRAQNAAAKLMGFKVTPQVYGADAQSKLLSQQLANSTTSWEGLNNALAATSKNRNTRVAQAFTNTGAQKISDLQQALAAAISQLQDYYVPGRAGRAGTAGHTKSALSTSQQLSILNQLRYQGNTDRAYDLSVAKYKQSTAKSKKGTTTTTVTKNSKGQKSVSKTTSR